MAYKTLRLPRLPTNWRAQPQLFERYWDEAMSSVEKNLNAINILPVIQAALEAAQAAAASAQASADTAQSSADDAGSQSTASALENSLVNSYPQTAAGVSLITASSTGLVTIASHTRVYGDSSLNPSVSVAGGTIGTGATSDQVVRVYYVQPSRAGGAVTYLFTVDPATSPAQGSDIHSVGAVVIPASGTTPGRGVPKPGYVDLR